MSILKFALSWENLDLDFVVVADDDTYLNLPEILNTLYENSSISMKKVHSTAQELMKLNF